MTTEEILENNKLIAEFMGYVVMNNITSKSFKKEGGLHLEKSNKVITNFDLEYHSSWDWLMPVVHKCYEVAPKDVREVNNENLAIFELGLLSPIGDVYKAVVEFIKWYNKKAL